MRKRTMTYSIALFVLLSVLMIPMAGSEVKAEEIVEGGTLRINLPSDIGTKNVFLRASTWEYDFCTPIYDELWAMWPDETGDYYPWMTEPEYTVSEDGLVWTFTLLKNMTWHDGVPITADDVVFTFDHVKRCEYPRWADVWTNVDHAEKVDDYTFKVHLSNPYAPFLRRIMYDIFRVVPKHIWEVIEKKPDFDPLTYDPTTEEMVGSGYFKLVEYVVGSHIKYVANKDYFRRGYKGPWGVCGPWVDEFIRPIITSPDAGLLALLAGDIDGYRFSGGAPPAAVPMLLQNPDISIHPMQSNSFCHWGFNTWMWPFSEKKFRHALAHALDLEEIVAVARNGYGVRGSYGCLPPHYFSPYYNPDVKDYEFNLAESAELLDELGIVDTDGDGWRDLIDPETGKLLESGSGPNTLEVYPPHYDPTRIRAAEMASEWLAQIPGGGIKLKVVVIEWKPMFKRVKASMDPATKPMTWVVCSGLDPDPDRMRDRFHSGKIPNPNYYGFNNSRFDELADAQRAIVDENERAKLIYEMQDIIAEELPFITFFYRTSVYPHRIDKFTGWQTGPLSSGLGGWSQACVHLRVAPKTMTLSLLEYPNPEVTEGTKFKLQLKAVDKEGNPVLDAKATALITGIPTVFTLTHVGDGVYETTVDTTGFGLKPYTLGVRFEAAGFASASTLISFELIAAPVNTPPFADFVFSPTSPTTEDTVQFASSASDPDGRVVSWKWDFGDGTTSTEMNPTHTYVKVGSYTVKFSVTDDKGAADTLTKSITVQSVPVPGNLAPTANFAYSPARPSVEDVVSFADASTDPDGTVVSWSWDFGDGTTSTDRNPTHTYEKEGTVTVKLTVFDDAGAANSKTVTMTVGAAAPPPPPAYTIYVAVVVAIIAVGVAAYALLRRKT